MRVLVSGVTGQDGAYLVSHLLRSGCEVWGSSRLGSDGDLSCLRAVGVGDRLKVVAMDPSEPASVEATLDRLRPDAIVNLSGQSSVAASFEAPRETLLSSAVAAANLLEWVRLRSPATRVVNAGSGDCFGETSESPADEQTRFAPRSPYAIGKCAVAELTRLYRVAYGLSVSTAFLFNHESPLRPEHFVTRKVVAAAIRIRAGTMQERLELGNLDIVRDWGWAPEYMDALWRMVQLPESDDFIIATGTSMSLQVFVSAVFAEAGLDWREHVVTTAAMRRPSDIRVSQASPERAAARLNWRAQTCGDAVPRRLFRQVSSTSV